MVTQADVGRRVRYRVHVPLGLTQLTEQKTRIGRLVSVDAKRAVVDEQVDSPVVFRLTRTLKPEHVSP